MLGDYDNAPDVVAYPRNETEISAVMDWAGGVSASLTPFGADRASAAVSSHESMGFVIRRPSHSTYAISVRLSR
jgi:alkyldihydroxyacetonephosphate synthase